MNEYVFLMHRDAVDRDASSDPQRWERYITRLRSTGQFDGGSSIGDGQCLRKGQPSHPNLTDLSGFIRVRATSLEDAKGLLEGNPVYEAGGTVEIRELPRQ